MGLGMRLPATIQTEHASYLVHVLVHYNITSLIIATFPGPLSQLFYVACTKVGACEAVDLKHYTSST